MTDSKPSMMLAKKFPLPAQSTQYQSAYAYDQDFEMWLPNFPNVPQNTRANSAALQLPYPDPNAVLTTLSQSQNKGAGIGMFKASFNIVPASWDDFDTQEWSPPGWIGSFLGAADYTARNIVPQTSTIRLHYDYFLVDPAGVVGAGIIKDSAGNTINAPTGADSLLNGNTSARIVSSIGAIPIIPRTFFCNTTFNNVSVPAYESHVDSLTPTGGFNGVYIQTFPTVEQYIVWCNNVSAIYAAQGNPWSSLLVWNGKDMTQAQASVGQIVLKESFLKPYAGNIIARITTYALTI